MADISCVILAGGLGTRFGSQKQFYELDGIPLWEYQAKVAREITDNVVVVGVDVEGGVSRQESVLAGLKTISTKRVIILEAARPLVNSSDIKRLLDIDSDSITYGVPVVDTIYQEDGNFPSREQLYLLQIPQVFNYELLLRCHIQAVKDNLKFTDDTSMMKYYMDINPIVIPGSIRLNKVTYQEDVLWLEALYGSSLNHRG